MTHHLTLLSPAREQRSAWSLLAHYYAKASDTTEALLEHMMGGLATLKGACELSPPHPKCV